MPELWSLASDLPDFYIFWTPFAIYSMQQSGHQLLAFSVITELQISWWQNSVITDVVTSAEPYPKLSADIEETTIPFRAFFASMVWGSISVFSSIQFLVSNLERTKTNAWGFMSKSCSVPTHMLYWWEWIFVFSVIACGGAMGLSVPLNRLQIDGVCQDQWWRRPEVIILSGIVGLGPQSTDVTQVLNINQAVFMIYTSAPGFTRRTLGRISTCES